MLFNSYVFILLFLPIVLTFLFFLGRKNPKIGLSWLCFASCIFYGWYEWKFLFLLAISIGVNFWISEKLAPQEKKRKFFFISGIVFNILLLGFFKYTNFLLDNLSLFFGKEISKLHILLPLAISFFTFQQISFLVDIYREKIQRPSLLYYGTLLLFFPHLIAGPIVRYIDLLPQFSKEKIFHINYANLCIGITLFIVGLFKKCFLADNLAFYADKVFSTVGDGFPVTFFEGWTGVFAFSFQIYFDFSGYSDMAIGLARMCNIRFPLNFYSPYQATSIIDFWRRWHITLSSFLKDYVYIGFGGNRNGEIRKYGNLFLTMLIGGLWHGASWIFILWGGLHGLYLVVNHLLRKIFPAKERTKGFIYLSKKLFIFLLVSLTWVFFRAKDFSSAITFFQSLIGTHGCSISFSLTQFVNNYSPKFTSFLEVLSRFSGFFLSLHRGELSKKG